MFISISFCNYVWFFAWCFHSALTSISAQSSGISDIKPEVVSQFRDVFYGADYTNDNHISLYELVIGVQSMTFDLDIDQKVDLNTFLKIVEFIPEKYSCIPSSQSPINMMDCLTITLRTMLQNIHNYNNNLYWNIIKTLGNVNTNYGLRNQFISFDDAFKTYLNFEKNICSDVSPQTNQFCSDLVERDPFICLGFGLGLGDNDKYCQLSCYLCPEIESNLLYQLFEPGFKSMFENVQMSEDYIDHDVTIKTWNKMWRVLTNNASPIRGTNGKLIQRPEKMSENDRNFHEKFSQFHNSLKITNDTYCVPVANATQEKCKSDHSPH